MAKLVFTFPCTECEDGHLEYRCYVCQGTGYVDGDPCQNCGGSGFILDKCAYCGGTRQVQIVIECNDFEAAQLETLVTTFGSKPVQDVVTVQL